MGRMNRRSFVQLGASIAGLAFASSGCGLQAPWAPWVRPRMPRIGWGSYGPREAFAKEYIDPFLQGLRNLGYVEGETIAIEWRFTSDQSNAELRRVAEEMVGLSVEVIVVGLGTGIGLELQKLTSTVPIVAPMISPVERGQVASLAHPGGNLTGPSTDTPGGPAKHLEMLREVVPGLSHVVFLVDGRAAVAAGADADWETFRITAAAIGLQAERVDLFSAADVEAAFETPAM